MSDTTDLIVGMIAKAVDALVTWGASQIGESTDTIKARVLKALAAPETDGTDAVAEDIDAAIKAAADASPQSDR